MRHCLAICCAIAFPPLLTAAPTVIGLDEKAGAVGFTLIVDVQKTVPVTVNLGGKLVIENRTTTTRETKYMAASAAEAIGLDGKALSAEQVRKLIVKGAKVGVVGGVKPTEEELKELKGLTGLEAVLVFKDTFAPKDPDPTVPAAVPQILTVEFKDGTFQYTVKVTEYKSVTETLARKGTVGKIETVNQIRMVPQVIDVKVTIDPKKNELLQPNGKTVDPKDLKELIGSGSKIAYFPPGVKFDSDFIKKDREIVLIVVALK